MREARQSISSDQYILQHHSPSPLLRSRTRSPHTAHAHGPPNVLELEHGASDEHLVLVARLPLGPRAGLRVGHRRRRAGAGLGAVAARADAGADASVRVAGALIAAAAPPADGHQDQEGVRRRRAHLVHGRRAARLLRPVRQGTQPLLEHARTRGSYDRSYSCALRASWQLALERRAARVPPPHNDLGATREYVHCTVLYVARVHLSTMRVAALLFF